MNWKDFNTIKINGKLISKENLEWLDQYPLYQNALKAWWNKSDFFLMKTSGSTGKPKTISLDKNKMLVSAKATCDFFDLDSSSVFAHCLSPQHIGGMMMLVRAMYLNAAVELFPIQSNPLLNLEKNYDFIALVPFQIVKIIEENPKKLNHFKHIIVGGGTISSNLEEQISKHTTNAYSTFGMTETISHFALRQIGKDDFYSCLPGIQIMCDKINRMIIKAPELIDREILTNDIIKCISPTMFIWKGRSDFVIESGGKKHHPEMIEAKIGKFIHKEFVIISRPHPQLNNEIGIVIEGEQKENLDFSYLPKHERPRFVFYLNQFPRKANNKIDRLAIQELLN